MMKPLAALAFAALLLFAQAPRTQKKQLAPKPPAVESYDPAHLRAGEVACGRERTGETIACRCMEHRVKASQEAQAACARLADRVERARCMVASEACAMVPTDADSAGYSEQTGERMPAQCKRSCTKARCECCQT